MALFQLRRLSIDSNVEEPCHNLGWCRIGTFFKKLTEGVAEFLEYH